MFIFILSCTPVNLTQKSKEEKNVNVNIQNKVAVNKTTTTILNDHKKSVEKNNDKKDYEIDQNITLLFSTKNKVKLTDQFTNVFELGVFDKKLENIFFEIKYFENDNQLEEIISKRSEKGKIFIGPIDTQNTKVAKKFCDNKTIFFSFSSDTKLAGDCIYLLNFFPLNELQDLFMFLEKDSKVALLYPENEYGYLINQLIDRVVNNSGSILVNRSSYKNDLSNVRDSIKELGKYELRKYELERQKKILSNKDDLNSKKRLKKLEKFKTTTDYDFTHILLADYGLNLLQVAPLLPYYDIDPEAVQFLSTGVIDDENFFVEPSLQNTIFPGVEKTKRLKLLNRYKETYDDNMLRIATLPYDLVGLLNYVFSKKMSFNDLIKLLNNSSVKFDGVDGNFYFRDNMIVRNLDILQISNGSAKKIN